MKRQILLLMAATMALASSCCNSSDVKVPAEITMSKEVLMDKIKGGWAGQTIGCTYGGPTEFRYNGTMIQDYIPIKYEDHCIKWWYDNVPGLYDDVYMDLTFVNIFDKYGLDAPVEKFALAFANADYRLWHANQAARYNIQHGIMPPMSGHWMNNPHADDIDFQIEADYAGLMAPAMVNSAIHYADGIGHIMNYGDGWYGGVFVAAMYSNAFIYNDAETIVRESIKVIPEESRFYQCINDVIRWYETYPEDWKQAWAEVEKNYSEDIGCPDGVFVPFNIDAVINSAYVAIGMLYGHNDYSKTMDIATRCGLDSDCNPATVGGILGTMMGYSNIPEQWMPNLREVEDMNFAYTDISLNKAYQMSFNQALQVIEKNGGKVTENEVTIKTQTPETVRYEKCFEGLWPVDRINIDQAMDDTTISFDFKGAGIAITYWMEVEESIGYVAEVEVKVDGKLIETVQLPDTFQGRKYDLFSKYDLEDKEHHVELTLLNKNDKKSVNVDVDGDGKIGIGANTVDNPGDRKIMGNSRPRLSYGFTLGADWKGFDLSIFFQGTGNHYWYPSDRSFAFWGPYCQPMCSYMPKDFMDDVWDYDNTDAYFPRARSYMAFNGYLSRTNDAYLQNVRYLRLKNLSVGYTIPAKLTKKIGVDNLRVYFSGENLAYWSPFKKHSDYIDPEATFNRGGNDAYNRAFYPWQKSFMFGVDISF